MRRFLFFVLVCLMIFPSGLHALQTITLTEGESAFIDISEKNLNLVKFPLSGVRVYTSSRSLDIKVDGGSSFIKYLESEAKEPQEVFFVLPQGVYSLILVPKPIPAQTVVIRIPREELSEALQWESSHSYEEGIKDLMKAMYEERPPRGFSVREAGEERSLWQGTKQTLKSLYTGATLEGEVYRVTNLSNEVIRFEEKEFYEEGVLAVSIEKHELLAKEETGVYLVKKTKTQKKLENLLKKQNPLTILHEHQTKEK